MKKSKKWALIVVGIISAILGLLTIVFPLTLCIALLSIYGEFGISGIIIMTLLTIVAIIVDIIRTVFIFIGLLTISSD